MTTQRVRFIVAIVAVVAFLVGGATYIAFDVQPDDVRTEIGDSAKQAVEKVAPAISV